MTNLLLTMSMLGAIGALYIWGMLGHADASESTRQADRLRLRAYRLECENERLQGQRRMVFYGTWRRRRRNRTRVLHWQGGR